MNNPCRKRRSSQVSSRTTDVSEGENYNQSSCQPATVRIVNSDNGDNGTSLVCNCGRSIVAPLRSKQTPSKSPVSVVTYKKKLGPDRMLIVREELEKPQFTTWIIIHAFLFILFLSLIYITIQILSHSFSKVEEILSVTTLLLIILVCFRPRCFIPLLVFEQSRKHDTSEFEIEECENEQYEQCE